MPKRCQHLQLVITEEGTSSTTHIRGHMGAWQHLSDFGDYTGMLEVNCIDCGLHKRFGKERPRWLVKLLVEAQNTD